MVLMQSIISPSGWPAPPPQKKNAPGAAGAFPGKWQALPGFHLAGLAVRTDGGVSALSFTLAFVVEVIEKRHRPFLDFHVLLNQGYRLQPRLHHYAGGVLPKHRVFAVPNHNGLFHEIKHDLLTYLSSQAHKFYVGRFPFPSRSYILSYLCHIFNMFRQVLQNIFWERELSFCPAPLKKTPENPGFSALFRGCRCICSAPLPFYKGEVPQVLHFQPLPPGVGHGVGGAAPGLPLQKVAQAVAAVIDQIPVALEHAPL